MKGLLPAALALFLSSLAAANGRIPTAVGVTYDHPQDPVLAGMTFGLLESEDGGRTYGWVCEQAIGISGAWDPQFAYLPAASGAGKIFASTPSKGVTLSSDGGCSFVEMGAPIGHKQISRLVLGADGHTVIAATNAAGLPAGERNAVYLSTDGAAFRETAISSDTLVFDWVEPAASDPMRLYAASLSFRYDGPRLHMSRDLGRTATDVAMPEPSAHQVQILGVERDNPDAVYVRLRVGAFGKLYKTPDAGMTWTPLFFGSITAAAYDPSSHLLYLSAAPVRVDPCTGQNVVDDASVLRSADGGATWQRGATDPKPLCFGFDPDRHLFACTFNSGKTLVARSADRGASFSPFVSVDPMVLTGTKRCPVGTPTHDLCEPLWPGLADQLGLGQGGAGGAGARTTGAIDRPRTRSLPRAGQGGCGGGGSAPPDGGLSGAPHDGAAAGNAGNVGSAGMGAGGTRPGGCASAPFGTAASNLLLISLVFRRGRKPESRSRSVST